MKKLKFIIVIAVIILFIAGCQTTSVNEEVVYKTISPEETLNALNNEENVVVIDVRTQEEYDELHIPRSKCLPLGELEEGIVDLVPDKETKIIVYCQTGNRSRTAAETLIELGYTNVYDMGGFDDWPYETESGIT